MEIWRSQSPEFSGATFYNSVYFPNNTSQDLYMVAGMLNVVRYDFT